MIGGKTVEQAIAEAHVTFDAWAMAEREDKGDLPAPKAHSGQFVQRIPQEPPQALSDTRRSGRRELEPARRDLPRRWVGPRAVEPYRWQGTFAGG